jgi:hypothetical protein
MPQTKSWSWLTYGLVALAAGLVVNTLLGPMFTGIVRYHYGDTLTNQGVAVDAVALFAAAPIAVAAARLTMRSHRAGPVLAFVPATFTAYMAPQYMVGPDYLGLPGNNEQFFLLHLGLLVVAVAVMVVAWSFIDPERLTPSSRRSDLRRSWILFGVAGFIALGRWLPGVLDLMSGQPSIPDYLDNPTSYLLIGTLDLGVVVPAAVAAAVGLRAGASWARTAAHAVIGWFALTPASVAAMNITMQINGDPLATTETTVLFVTAAVIFTAGAVLLYRPLFTRRDLHPDAHASSRADAASLARS